MSDKTQVDSGLRMYIKDLRDILGKEPKIISLRIDNGTEYKTDSFKTLLNELKISVECAEPNTPTHSGTAEWFNRDIQEKGRAILFDSGIPEVFWDYAVGFAVHVYNRTLHKSIAFDTPFTKLRNQEPDLKYIKRFGCLAFIHNAHPKGKWGPRARRAFLLGCTNTGYILLSPETGTITRAKHVTFIESKV